VEVETVPNRILKESICTSATLDKLTSDEEVLFYRLITAADDYGRFDGRPEVILARCFPLKVGKVALDTFVVKLNRLADSEIDLIRFYVVEGKPYFYFPTWENHQQIRAKRSKYPAPLPGETVTYQPPAVETACNQALSEDSTCHRESESNPNRESESEVEPGFATDATETERLVLHELKGAPGYRFDYPKDLAYIRKLATDFPTVDLLKTAKEMYSWLLDNPKKAKENSSPRLRLRNFCVTASKRKPVTVTPQEDSKAAEFLDFFAELFTVKHHAPPVFTDRDRELARTLCATYTEDQLGAMVHHFFNDSDEFVERSGYTVRVFYGQVNRLLGKVGG
jgi:hypothetical protein